MIKKPIHRFQFISLSIFLFFSLIMIYAAYIAFSRNSGSTKLDVAKMQKLRYETRINHPSSTPLQTE